jgi:glycosyltransferase involved in cell wall biosynthesis
MLEFSVIVCTHNPRTDNLTRALAALRAQSFAFDRWELLLIDNASKDPISPRFDLSWHPGGRHIREDELGLTPARLRGFGEAKGNVLILVDDDNLLAPNYLVECSRIVESHPYLGTFGAGEIQPEFAISPPLWTEEFWGNLAVRTISQPSIWSNLVGHTTATPLGAGMIVRREIADQYRGFETEHIVGRKGTELCGGEDFDIAWTGLRMGYGMGLFRALSLTHLIPSERLQPDYLCRLMYGSAKSFELLKHRHGIWSPPIRRSWYTRTFEHFRQYRAPGPVRQARAAYVRGVFDAAAAIQKGQAPAN